jgi:hypothetical protein
MNEELSHRVTFSKFKLRLSGKKHEVFDALDKITETFGEDAKLEDVLEFIRHEAIRVQVERN